MRKRQPDTEAQRLVQTYADLILRLGYTYLKSTHDAEDVCQNVLIKLLQTDRAFESAEHERAWIVRATANACKDVLRSARRRTSVALDAVAEAAAPEVPDSAVLEAVMELSQPFREAHVPALLRGLHRARDRGHDGRHRGRRGGPPEPRTQEAARPVGRSGR